MSSDRNPRTTNRLTYSLATVHHRGHWSPGSLSRWISVARSRPRSYTVRLAPAAHLQLEPQRVPGRGGRTDELHF